jgi:hypothetical protein
MPSRRAFLQCDNFRELFVQRTVDLQELLYSQIWEGVDLGRGYYYKVYKVYRGICRTVDL